VDEYWMVRAKQSTAKQAQYFGNFSWRPYLLLKIDSTLPVDDKLVKDIIHLSFDEEPHPDARVHYKKYCELGENEVLEFQYSKTLIDSDTGRFFYERFINIMI